MGLAFQIVDDVLDLTATEEVLGKPVASDLREGKATLAVIHAADHGTAADRKAIQPRARRPQFRKRHPPADPRDPGRATALSNTPWPPPIATPSKSRQALAPLPESEYKRALLWVPDFVVAREK